MSDNDSMKTPLIDNLRAAPVDLRCEWAFQWAEDGSAIGHARAPVGKICHEAADEIEALQRRVEELEEALDGAQIWLSAALQCPSWHWDPHQGEAAEGALLRANKALKSNKEQS